MQRSRLVNARKLAGCSVKYIAREAGIECGKLERYEAGGADLSDHEFALVTFCLGASLNYTARGRGPVLLPQETVEAVRGGHGSGC